ncbi:unnamed protein product, partial [Prunus brigantina]
LVKGHLSFDPYKLESFDSFTFIVFPSRHFLQRRISLLLCTKIKTSNTSCISISFNKSSNFTPQHQA